MPITIPDKSGQRRGAEPAPLWRRLVWFAALYCASIAVVGGVAYGIRLWLKA